jgi:diguanylate cyclase (GGDEF)-like protein
VEGAREAGRGSEVFAPRARVLEDPERRAQKSEASDCAHCSSASNFGSLRAVGYTLGAEREAVVIEAGARTSGHRVVIRVASRGVAGVRLRGALLLAVPLFCVLSMFGQTTGHRDARQALTQYRIDRWQTEQGLPLNTVQALLQTRDGYLWVGTGGGLARFDGVRFATFESSSVPELATRSIFGFMEDRAGNLWIGHSEGATIHRQGEFRVAFGREVTNGRRVWAFAEGPDGTIWVASENGLVQWKGGVRKVFGKAEGLPTDRLRALAFDRDGTLWIATTGAGLVSFNGERFEALTPENGFPHRSVRAVLADPAGGVWATTPGNGLVLVRDGTIRIFTVADGLPTDQVTALARDAEGTLWVGTWGSGIARMRDEGFDSISTEGGLAGGQIWSLHADREGSVWVGTWVDGLNRLRKRDFVVLGTPEGLSHDNVRSVLQASDGSVWVTTSGGGVNRIHQGSITSIGARNGLPTDETSCLLEDRDGSIWIGTYTAGVARLRNGRIEVYGVAAGLPSIDVRVIFQDRSGTVWASTVAGLARFDGSRFTAVREPGAPPQGASAILEDRAGTLWMGTDEGLFRYRNGVYDRLTREDGLLSNWIISLYEDAGGTLWIGTNGEGLNRLRGGKLSAIRSSDGLWDGLIQVILEDRHGNLWITSNRGFFRVSRAELDAFAEGRTGRVTSVGYGPGEGLRSTTFAGGLQPAGAVDAEGHLWLPSFSGLVIVDPSDLPGAGIPPRVRLEELVVNGVAMPPRPEITLPPGSLPLAIRYTATTLLNADRVRFRYRMEGASDGWVDAGRSREAFFPALPHGRYRFRVAGSLDGSTWRESAMPLAITVQPRLFQTRWFIALMGLALLGVTATILQLRTRSLRLQKIRMERLVEEKTEELRLANEHLARISFVDALTGLPNRRRLDESLEREWQRALRFETSLAVIVADVDLFKEYNDTLGHLEGDRCLTAVADVFLQMARQPGDLVARYGGEEFVVLMPGADRETALSFAEELRRECYARAIPHPASPVAPVVTISLGVAARVPSDETSSVALVMEADAALYRAKREGRNRVAG